MPFPAPRPFLQLLTSYSPIHHFVAAAPVVAVAIEEATPGVVLVLQPDDDDNDKWATLAPASQPASTSTKAGATKSRKVRPRFYMTTTTLYDGEGDDTHKLN